MDPAASSNVQFKSDTRTNYEKSDRYRYTKFSNQPLLLLLLLQSLLQSPLQPPLQSPPGLREVRDCGDCRDNSQVSSDWGRGGQCDRPWSDPICFCPFPVLENVKMRQRETSPRITKNWKKIQQLWRNPWGRCQGVLSTQSLTTTSRMTGRREVPWECRWLWSSFWQHFSSSYSLPCQWAWESSTVTRAGRSPSTFAARKGNSQRKVGLANVLRAPPLTFYLLPLMLFWWCLQLSEWDYLETNSSEAQSWCDDRIFSLPFVLSGTPHYSPVFSLRSFNWFEIDLNCIKQLNY